ncbi:cytochrome P450-like protein 22 [Sarcoptes scabiei]|uniref:Cytochrome P450-like protein 22 n=1 Tax=Sarcoptes scabiei TaxID=52283 RepID=A0A132AIP7_SARSC|nr:cytochrome P450-like protein 22 [Sarcoptes scabiei]
MWTRERIELTQQRILKTLDKTIYGFDMFGTIHIVVAEPDLIQSILSKEFQNFPNRRQINLNDEFFSNALSIVEGDQWKRIRAVVTPTFATGKMRTMKPIIDSVAEKLIQNIQNNLKPHCPLNMKNFVSAKDNPIIKMARKMFNVDLSVKNMLAIGLL